MERIPKTALGFIGGVIAALIIVYFAKNNLGKPLDLKALIIIAIAVVSLVIIVFLIYTSLTSAKDDPYPLGLPSGSVRALLALLILVFFVLTSIAFCFSPKPVDPDLAKDIVKTLGTLLIAVSAFYFGSKSAEKGTEMAADAFNGSSASIGALDFVFSGLGTS